MASLRPAASACHGEDLLSAYLDGELRPGELERVARHLGECPDCVAVFHGLKAVRTAVRVLPPVDPPPSIVPHFHVGDELSAYLDGELATDEVDAVGLHLAGCADCRTELAELDAARTAVRALPRLEPVTAFMPPGDHHLSVDGSAGRLRRRRLVAGFAAAVLVASVVAVGADRGGAGVAVDMDELLNRHNARSSVESGFSVIPVVAPQETGR